MKSIKLIISNLFDAWFSCVGYYITLSLIFIFIFGGSMKIEIHWWTLTELIKSIFI